MFAIRMFAEALDRLQKARPSNFQIFCSVRNESKTEKGLQTNERTKIANILLDLIE